MQIMNTAISNFRPAKCLLKDLTRECSCDITILNEVICVAEL